MEMSRRTLGTLECVVCEPSGPPKLLVSFCHGFGASGTDLLPLAEELAGLSKVISEHVAMVFPAAPIELKEFGYGARCWWPIRFADLQNAMMTGDFSELREFIPPQMFEMRDRLAGAVAVLAEELKLPKSKCVLGGFSQGAMLSTETVLASDEDYGGLMIWSGTLLSEGRWKEGAARHRAVPVLQSHGTFDQVLPFALSEELTKMLTNAGMSVEFTGFPQGHTIPYEVLEESAKFLSKLCEAGE